MSLQTGGAMKSKKKKKNPYATLLMTYRDPSAPGSLGGMAHFARAQKLPTGKVRETMECDLGYILHTPRRQHFPTLPVMVFSIDEQWVADLIEVINIAKSNRSYRYLLTVVDVFSKYAWVQLVKSKSGQDVTTAFEKILKRSQGWQPQNLQMDDSKEFYNKYFQALIKGKNIHHFSTSGDTKASIVERFNHTLKERLYRYFTIKNTLTFLPVLQDLVLGYNRSYHRSIKMASDKVTASSQEEVWNNLYAKHLNAKHLKPKFKVNDCVRLNKKLRTFKKGHLLGWMEEVFIVSRVIPGSVVTYKIKEMDDTPLQGTFYSQDLQKVTVSDNDLYPVEKVLKRKGNKLLVC